jgi:hypothetical protein
MYLFGLGKLSLEDELDDLVGDEVSHTQEDTGDDHKADHDPRGLHDLPSVWPLYPLELSPASLKEMDQAAADPGPPPRVRSPSGSEFAAGVATAPAAAPAPATAATLPTTNPAATATGLDGLLGQLLLGHRLAQIRPPHRQLGVGQLDIRCSVLDRVRRMLAMRILWILVPRRPRRGDPRLRHGTVGGPMRPPFATTFAVAGHERVRLCSARLAMSRVAPAPAAVLAQLQSFRIIPLALVGLIVPALALLAREGGSDPNVSTGHLALPRSKWW